MVCSITLTFLSLMILTKSFGIDGTNHFICKTIEEAFTSESQIESGDASSDSTIQHIQGRPGKRGIQGMKGEIGPPGNVNYEAIDLKLESKVDQEMQESMREYGSTVAELQDEVRKLKQRQDLCKVFYAGKCFWFVFHNNQDVTYSQLEELCAQNGGTPANSYGRNHFEEIDAYVDSITQHTTFFTGMTINNSNKIIRMNNGIKASWTVGEMRWFPSHPIAHADRTLLAVHSNRDPGSSHLV
uniref:pulmonary surfactant-associated protein A2-like n=1 Tax=Styela clava TaxID=7725 RepID=UPI00193A900F|nr:pulmonary surfactant-associated protein A2-like [Styela clava]